MTDINGYKKLEENIQTTIYEGLLKLGYEAGDRFSIYYDLDLLSCLLGVSFKKNEECLSYLQAFITYANNHLIDLKIILERNRFKFTVPEAGIAFILRNNQDNPFLKDLIDKVNTHNFTLDDILAIFSKYSKNYTCEEIDNSEFQYVIYFNNNAQDKFKYCFTFDQMGGYYHRLLDFSYNKIIQD